MTIVLVTTARDAANNAITARVNLGSGFTGGRMLIKTAGGAVLLATLQLANPAFGASSGGTSTASGVPISAIAVATGVAAVMQVADRDGTLVYSGTVGIAGSGADAIIDSVNITINDVVQLNSHTLTAPA
jgi:hypothetical protein